VGAGRIYDFEQVLGAYGGLLRQFQERADALASDERLGHRARQTALWVLADGWRLHLERTVLGRWTARWRPLRPSWRPL
jgi:hypothetical protein